MSGRLPTTTAGADASGSTAGQPYRDPWHHYGDPEGTSFVSVADPMRWVARRSFAWAPVLPYLRRRVNLLDWLDENADVVAVYEQADLFGVAIGSRSQRVLVRRDGLDVLTLDPAAEISPMLETLGGVLTNIQPRRMEFEAYSATWSLSLSGEYERERRGLAARALGQGREGMFRSMDVSVLADLESEHFKAQVEFGVVSDDELRMRLSTGELSRVNRGLPDLLEPEAHEFPTTSLFAEVYLAAQHPMRATTVQDIANFCLLADRESAVLVRQIDQARAREGAAIQ